MKKVSHYMESSMSDGDSVNLSIDCQTSPGTPSIADVDSSDSRSGVRGRVMLGAAGIFGLAALADWFLSERQN